MKNMKELAKEVCKREGLKKQVDIAQVAEILGHVSDILYLSLGTPAGNNQVGEMIYKNGERRAKKAKKCTK